jgi:hypothetical protein
MSADWLKLDFINTPQLRNVGYERSPQNRHYSYRKPLGTIKMKRYITILIYLLISESIYAQNIGDIENDTLFKTLKIIQINELKAKEDTLFKVELYVRNICDNTISKLNNYILSGYSKNYAYEDGICYVHQKGQYRIEGFGINYFDKCQINIQSTNHIDTLVKYRIYIARSPGIPPWPYYSYCGKRCDGMLTDYYENGNIRIEGEFKNGQIKNIRLFNKEGQLTQRIKNYKLHSLHEVYDNGKLIIRLKRVLFINFNKV